MLILFDIDGTLLLSGGAGRRAMAATGRTLYGSDFSFDGIEFAGRLDPLIWREAMRGNGREASEEAHERFRVAYRDRLRDELRTAVTTAMPGTHELLGHLRGRDDVVIGLLTGNYAETGALKLDAAGFDLDHFPVRAWGADGPTRNDLPAVAQAHCRARGPEGVRASERLVIIGDTPHDVACARAGGGMAIGVSTGPSFGRRDLESAGADLVLDDLSRVDDVLEWLDGLTFSEASAP